MMMPFSALGLKSPHFYLMSQPSFHILRSASSPSFLRPTASSSQQKLAIRACRSTTPKAQPLREEELLKVSSNGSSRVLLLGVASLGLALLLAGIDGKEALALGPEGPLAEEFWDNVRRYGLYILTVSTGVLYAVLQPILELLKSPVSAILVITILVGSAYILSQILSLMIGVTVFSYDYAS